MSIYYYGYMCNVKKWDSGKSFDAPADTAVRIAGALGVSVEFLVTGEETAIPRDIRSIIQRLQQLNKKDRKVVSALIKALIEKQEK